MMAVNQWGKSISPYWASPLNKFIDLNCEHKFTNINIDCFQVKLEKKIIRFIEYKRSNESMGFQQLKALKILASQFKTHDGWQFQVCIFRGDEPFAKAQIEDLTLKRTFTLVGTKNVKAWLEFKGDLSTPTEMFPP